MGKVIVINVNRCNGCYNCQISCKDEHVGNEWMPYARPQPNTGHFWMKLIEKERGSIPKVKVTYIPRPCMHCDDAPCMRACKVGAIYKRNDGIVIIDPVKCTGCKDCIYACPYEAIYFNDVFCIAQKCTMCAHLLDSGWKEPRCVDACPTEALKFGEEEELRELIAKAETMNVEIAPYIGLPKMASSAKPRVYYLGLPRRFIAGAVFDPEEDECIEDATVTITDLNTGEAFTAKTDNYGDFWVHNLKISKYSVKIEKDGYYPKEITPVTTEKDVNIGDIELHKKKV